MAGGEAEQAEEDLRGHERVAGGGVAVVRDDAELAPKDWRPKFRSMEKSVINSTQLTRCTGLATCAQLTKRAGLDGESEKAEPNLRWLGISGEWAMRTSRLERDHSPVYWPF